MNLLIESHFTSWLDYIHTNKGDINETAVDRACRVTEVGGCSQHFQPKEH